MKTQIKIYLSLMIGLFGFQSYAAQDPAVSNPNIQPNPATIGETAVVSFNIGNTGSTTIPGTSEATRMSFTLTLSSGFEPTVADGLGSISGLITNYFDITYNPAQRLFVGRQKLNVAIPALTLADIAVAVNVIGSPVSATVNIQPNATAQAAGQPRENDFATVETALPVTLKSFDVIKENKSANLTWSTTEEVNSDRFEIEHSLNAKQWNLIGNTKANGDSKMEKIYHFSHVNPASGNNYYRLKMIDRDGTFEYSGIRSIEMGKNFINIYPNPVAEMLIIETNPAELTRVQLYNTSGIPVFDSGDMVKQQIDVRNLSNGIYMVRLSHINGSFETHKIMVVK
jgi:hypothetical protein